jgi:hypothetical protein
MIGEPVDVGQIAQPCGTNLGVRYHQGYDGLLCFVLCLLLAIALIEWLRGRWGK